MQNFETLIGQALANGVDPDVIAKQMTEALNTACKQKQEAEAKAKAISVREKMIKNIEEDFWKHIKEKKLSDIDAVALTWLVMVTDTEYGKSIDDVDTLKDLFNHIANVLSHIDDSFRVTRDLKDTFGDVANILGLSQIFKGNVHETLNKRKEESTCVPDRNHKPTIPDKEHIETLLRNL